jgi:hypothetical protein
MTLAFAPALVIVLPAARFAGRFDFEMTWPRFPRRSRVSVPPEAQHWRPAAGW